MSFTRFLRSHFFSTIGDTKINNFWTRFLDGSKPNQNTFEELTASAAFHAEINSAAQIDSSSALVNKQGLVIASDDASAKAGSDTALNGTGGTKVPQNRHLPIVTDSIVDQTIREFIGQPLVVAKDATGSNNKYSLEFSEDLITQFDQYLLPLIETGDEEKVVSVKADGTGYELTTVSAGTGGDSYRSTSTTSNSIAKGSKTFTITPASGTPATAIGNRIRFTDSGNSSNYVEGIVSAASPTSITIIADNTGGTGTIASWTGNLGGNIPSSDTTGVPNLFVSDLGGDDSTGDGSIIKPFKTIAYAQSLVTNNQSIIVFGGSYTNSINIVKSGIDYTLNCYPGVNITQTVNSLVDSLTVNGRVDIVGEPNIVCTALTVPCFVINQVSVTHLGKVESVNKIADLYTKLYKRDGITTENTVFTLREGSWHSTTEPAIKLMRSGADPNGTILLNITSLEYTQGFGGTNANYIEISNPYTAAISGNLQHRGATGITTPTLIKLTSSNFSEIAINRLTCRMGGTTSNPVFLDLGGNDVTSKYFFLKDIQMSVVPCTFVTASTASSLYAENIYLVNGSTLEGGSATIKTMTAAKANTRTFIGSDVFMAALYNL